MQMKSLILVMAGGAAGSAFRYAIGQSLNAKASGWPWGTMTVNVTGGFAMGLLAAWVLRAGDIGEPLRLLLGVGLLGGFTTFSAFSLELVQMIQRGAVVMALGYSVMSVLLSVMAVFGGLQAGKMVFV
jgi:fluoride exporter